MGLQFALSEGTPPIVCNRKGPPMIQEGQKTNNRQIN